MEQDFVIGKVSWFTEVKRNYTFDSELCYTAFKSAIDYFQKESLTTRTILGENELVTPDTCIKVSDLTDEGFQLAKKCFDKWLDSVIDKIVVPTDYRMLDRALKKIRSVS
ncbi:hypothetical protein [uncultured Mucilaginibacter sp.]|uniref:hypothetical protein n=1 Tax=uncultured Mucilaginibacter sp. TaxID=797541 RepID=UPI0025DB8B40|nr:hypothetical protein [uncultured Mucilaginibacter sp.]